MAEQDTAKSTQTPDPKDEEFVLTPEIMQHENRRLDLVLSGAVLAYAFFLGAFKDESPDLWMRFKTGQIIAESGIPRTDTLSYTAEGQPWVNPSWLFDWLIYVVFGWFGPAILIALKSIIVVVAAVCLLGLRHPGPTLWSAVVTAAFVVTASSSRLSLQPDVLSLALFAGLVLCWFQSRHRNRERLLYLAVPITLFWANIDFLWPMAPMFLLLVGIGESLQRFVPKDANAPAQPAQSGTTKRTLAVACGCVAVGLLNPFTISGWTFPITWFTQVLPEIPGLERADAGWHSAFGDYFGRYFSGEAEWSRGVSRFIDRLYPAFFWDHIAWTVLLIGTFGSFFLNYAGFQVSRLLAVIGIGFLPIVAERFLPFSAVALGVVALINAQEFYLAAWGVEPRISRGWLIWSQGGRAVTVVCLFLAVIMGFTGRIQGRVGRFGFGIAEDRYMIEAAEWLSGVPFQGRCFAFVERQAGYLAYAREGHKNFVDSRWQLFVANGALANYSLIRNALSTLNVTDWQKKYNETPAATVKRLLDEHQVTHLVVDPADSRVSGLRPGGAPMRLMLDNPELAPLHVSDRAIVLGRTAPSADQQLIKERRIDANNLAFRTSREPAAPTERDVFRPGYIDWVWRHRHVLPKGLFVGTAYYGGLYGGSVRSLAKPGADYLAVAALRNAVSSNPDNPEAYFHLGRAYENLLNVELEQLTLSEQLRMRGLQEKADAKATGAAKSADAKSADMKTAKSAKPPSQPATKAPVESVVGPSATFNLPQVQIPPSNAILALRHRQVMTAYQNAVLAGGNDGALHQRLASFCHFNGFLDFALHHLERAIDLLPEADAEELRQRFLDPLQTTVLRQREAYDEMVARMERELEQAGQLTDRPIERASLAANFQLMMLARDQLELASLLPIESASVVPFASELYLSLGLPGKAEEQLRFGRMQQQLAAGQWERSMAHIRILNGQYTQARELLEQAITEIRRGRTTRQLNGLHNAIVNGAIFNVLNDMNQMQSDTQRESLCLFELGMLRIEMGDPTAATREFEKVIRLTPSFNLRPIIRFYWSLITDAKMPLEAPDVDIENEIVERFKQPEPEKKKSAPTEKTSAVPKTGATGQSKEPTTTSPATKSPAPRQDDKKAAPSPTKAAAK